MPLQSFAGFEAGDPGEMVTYSGGVAVSAAAKRNGNYGCRLTVPSGMLVTSITVGNGYDANGNPATISRTAYTVGFGLRVLALIERDPAIAALLAKLDAGWKLPKNGDLTVDPSNATAEARIVRHLMRERLEQCAASKG